MKSCRLKRTFLLAASPWLLVNQVDSKPRVQRERFAQGLWQLTIQQDRFSGGLACSLHSRDHRAFYEPGAVALHFPSGRDVSVAVYRIDMGPPRSARDNLPQLVRMGIPVYSANFLNESNGQLWIPYEQLANAKLVIVESSPALPLQTFRLDGLSQLTAYASGVGCWPNSQFIR